MNPFKSLRVPARLFAIAMWAVSILFAWFLTGLGRLVVGGLPGVAQGVSMSDFIDRTASRRIYEAQEAVRAQQAVLTQRRARVVSDSTARARDYAAAQAAFDNWIATRTATTNPQQDPEVLRRQAEVDSVKALERGAMAPLEAIDAELVLLSQRGDSLRAAYGELEDAARPAYDRAVFRDELRIFAIRLAIALPLLLAAIWMFLRRRRSDYWPLYRGFILFALTVFFFELVPYLPSYGGYVRYAVGVLLTLGGGIYGTRAMKAYLAKRAVEEAKSQDERRQTLSNDEALRRMTANICPGCERGIPGAPNPVVNFCVHCGLKLFDTCGQCRARHNAFYHFCPECGSRSTAAPQATAPAPA